MLKIVLISTYELGRQPFGLASPAAWLREAAYEVNCFDLSISSLEPERIKRADLVAFYVPMHMGTRMTVPLIEQVRQLNPTAHLCAYGLYAPVNANYLHRLGVGTVLGGEFESGMVALVGQLGSQRAEVQRCRGAEVPTDSPQPPSSPAPQSDEDRLASLNPLALQPSNLPGQLAINNEQLTSPSSQSSGLPTFQSSSLPVSQSSSLPTISLKRQRFLLPDRTDLPTLRQYAQLVTEDGHKLVGYTEATRGCKHLCRHCPIVPVYGGLFRVVQRDIVLADIRQQVDAGAQHITFGDPDFFNGPGHALAIVQSLHEQFSSLSYDVTIKVEHLLKYAKYLPVLKETGCLFITTAVESFDEDTLTVFDKRHTVADFEAALTLCRDLDLLLAPTFVAFTPWTTLASYRRFLTKIVRLNLVDQVSPIQCAIRLLIPPDSRLLELSEMWTFIGYLDEGKLSYTWRNPDPRVDALQADLEYLVQSCTAQNVPRRDIFGRIWERAFEGVGDLQGRAPFPQLPPWSRFVPYLTEPWYC